MTAAVQNLENGFERNWKMADLDGAIESAIGAMATGSFNLIGVAAIKLTIGVYVEDLAIDDVKKSLAEAMAVLNYGKSSRYALVAAALDASRELIKRLGRPDGVERNVFWQMLEETETVMDATAFMVAAIKSNFGVDTVQQLTAVLKGKPEAKPAKASAKVEAVSEPTPTQPSANDGAPLQTPAQAILSLAAGLSDDELATVLAQLTEMVQARAVTQETAKAA